MTSIEIAPPLLYATIPPRAPVIARPLADWVNWMSPLPPVCVSVKAVYGVSTGVSEFSVTTSDVSPDALSVCGTTMASAPLQVNTPLPADDSTQLLEFTTVLTRSKERFCWSNTSL